MAPSNGYPVHDWDRGIHDDSRRCSHPKQNSAKGKERLLLSPRGTETIKYPEKLKGENCVAPPYIRQHRERRPSGDARAAHPKALECRLRLPLKGMATADEELVKHMSNLPAYLQRIDRGENFQEKVLNFGVLDWTRLEKWKLNQKGDADRGGSAVISSSTIGSNIVKIPNVSSSLPTAISSKTLSQKSDLKGPLKSNPGSFHKDIRSRYMKPTSYKVMRSRDNTGAAKVYLDVYKKIPSASGRDDARSTICEREKRKGSSQETDFNTVNLSTPVKTESAPKEGFQKNGKEGKHLSEAGTSSTSKFSRFGEQRVPIKDETKDRVEKTKESDVEVLHQPHHRKQKSVVLLLPTRYPESSLPAVSKEEANIPFAPRFSVPNRSSFSDPFSSGDFRSGMMFSEVPKSCPLPSQAASQSESVSPTVEPSSGASPASSGYPQISQPFKCPKRRGSNSVASLDVAAELIIGDQECPEGETRRSRNSSPNRRFSFSLGRMTRSLSLKETTSVPQLAPTYVSTKSGPVTNNDTPGYIANQEKVSSTTRGRSSPLRRLLDPLLKSRSMKSHHPVENVQPPKPVNTPEPLLQEKYEKCTVQALLQLTMKNGNPLFKFVVDNNSDVLAATISSAVSGRKDGSFRSCTFYSVNEIKKKSISWIGHSNKGKDGGFAYNVVGQMKLSSPFSDWTMKGLNQQIITRECVLFSVDSKQTDRQPASSCPSGELAAIAIKFSANENGSPNSVTVILPGGVHGMPAKGEPSPLIQRWKSGGSCDCGGWDVGCKLKVLSNENCSRKSTETLKASPTSDHLELYLEEGPQSSRPVLSLAPFRKDIYSIEFDSSISLLQAFSISVAYMMNCQEAPSSPELNCLSAANVLREPALSRNTTLKAPVIFQREGTARYGPCPPLSPVGRV